MLDHLPERDRDGVCRRLRQAWDDTDHDRALDRLEQLASELGRSHPGAAASLREGMAETLTLTRLGITAPLIGQPPNRIGSPDPSGPVRRFGPQSAAVGRGPRSPAPARARVRLVPPDGVRHPQWQQGVAPLSAGR